jgi:hypothetical protein
MVRRYTHDALTTHTHCTLTTHTHCTLTAHSLHTRYTLTMNTHHTLYTHYILFTIHAWSQDGVTWSEPRVGAYNTTIKFTNGSSMVCQRRERPQMILDPLTKEPLAMSGGVTGCPPIGYSKGGGDCFTLIQRMR